MANLTVVVRQLRLERDRAADEVKRLNAALAALTAVSRDGASTTSTARQGRLSAAARARIAAAQRARWAKLKGGSGAGVKAKVVSMPKQRTMSAAARRKIAAAQRARWAKVKAAKKSA
ncbi:MAG TPA: hypothetical protein VFO39_16155 [Candidatus Sulfotelmatobacter sp.]|nr:hypothetical protein [Candidatus Sulfotelmatobacter sp.]